MAFSKVNIFRQGIMWLMKVMVYYVRLENMPSINVRVLRLAGYKGLSNVRVLGRQGIMAFTKARVLGPAGDAR